MESNTLVWVKVEGYPWWPAVVIDKDAFESLSGTPMPNDRDTAVQFFGTNEPGCVDSHNTDEVIPFNADTDSDKLAPSDDEGCNAAIAMAVDMWRAAVAESVAADSSNALHADADGVESVDGEADADADAEARRKARKKEKKDKKEKKEKDKMHKKDKERKHKDKKRSRRSDSDDDVVPSDDDDDRHTRAVAKHRDGGRRKESAAASASKAATTSSTYVMSTSDAASGALMQKRVPKDTELTGLRDDLLKAIGTENLVLARSTLSELAKVCVTATQLKRTKIGIVMSTLLSPGNPLAACGFLVKGILKYWLSQLPDSLKERLETADEVDHASNASVDDADEPVEDIATLDNYGLNVERCFMVEEAELNDDGGDEAAASTTTTSVATAAHIAKLIEAEMPPDMEDLRDVTLTYLKGSEHAEVRRSLLLETLKVSDFISMMRRMLAGEPITNLGASAGSSTEEKTQPLDASIEDEYENVTHQFTCPHCEHHSAQTSEMVTGGHGEDHVTVLWATCTRCNKGWKVE